jgi:hypothetical protein
MKVDAHISWLLSEYKETGDPRFMELVKMLRELRTLQVIDSARKTACAGNRPDYEQAVREQVDRSQHINHVDIPKLPLVQVLDDLSYLRPEVARLQEQEHSIEVHLDAIGIGSDEHEETHELHFRVYRQLSRYGDAVGACWDAAAPLQRAITVIKDSEGEEWLKDAQHAFDAISRVQEESR